MQFLWEPGGPRGMELWVSGTNLKRIFPSGELPPKRADSRIMCPKTDPTRGSEELFECGPQNDLNSLNSKIPSLGNKT